VAIADLTAKAPAPRLVSLADNGTCCGLPPPLSLTDTAPLKVPREDELKVTVMEHDPFAATLVPHVWVWEKVVEPVIVIPLTLSVAVPVLVSVIVCGGGGQVLGTLWQEKARLVGLNFTTVPAPFRLTFCGLPGALSVIDSVPLRALICVGLKPTLMVQLARGARLEPQVFDWLKSPLAVMLVISSIVVP
jgi:hypothetical protein